MHPEDAYDQCLALVTSDSAQAFEAALAWRDFGGGLPAQHCVARVLVSLENYEEGATRLEELAVQMRGYSAESRAEVLAEAGRAWTLAQKAERAYAAVTAGLQIDPTNVELLIDRSEILFGTQTYWDALDDLNRALELAPDRVDALIFRATTYRFLDVAELAMEDLERALTLAPDQPEALVERGMLRRLGGDDNGARADWLRAIQVAPDSSAALIAQSNIQRLELGDR